MYPLIADAGITLSWETVISGLSLIAAGSAWIYLPKRVDALELEVTEQRLEIKQLKSDHAASNNALGELKTAIEFMRESIEKIAFKLNVT